MPSLAKPLRKLGFTDFSRHKLSHALLAVRGTGVGEVKKELTALVVVRSPFQAIETMSAMKLERVDVFDVLYLTQENSREDQYYYGQLSQKARRARYIHTYCGASYLLRTLDFYLNSLPILHPGGYSICILGSINDWVISAIAVRKAKTVVTVDEGASNFIGSDSIRTRKFAWRSHVYRVLLGAPSLRQLDKRIARHYSYLPHFQNIVEADRVRPMELPWTARAETEVSGDSRTYFIGQPFGDYLTSSQIDRVREWLKQIEVSFYIPHPREQSPPITNSPILDKKTLVAEQAIVENANGAAVHLIGCSTGVLLYCGNIATSRTMLIISDQPGAAEWKELAIESGCNVVVL